MRNEFQIKQGFTLIELLVVIAIVGVLVALAFPNFFAARQRARDLARKSDLKQLQKALELYKEDQIPVAYPTNAPVIPPRLDVACNTKWSSPSDIYMPKMPCDPLGQTPYFYLSNPSDKLSYTFVACLENRSDPDRDNPKNAAACPSSDRESYTLNEP
ncbi:prepilin-type N-terminal cleavage/methylation domain-containing protein [Candidatus Gottesmanbacteria bacterium]|nr:prepilin-type N-terminal cleavage/methylation domain-containing protein [Candidatus Gottesmanbacteria bacterium]